MAENMHTREDLIDLVNDGIDELGCTADELFVAVSRVTNVKFAEKKKEAAREADKKDLPFEAC